ncbi:hypothetical protein Tco_0963230 [Tanacetum coccineum]
MESLNSNSQERELYQLQQMQHKAKESCMKSFRLLQSHLQVLSYNDLKINGCFERAFATLFEQDVQTFTGIMLLNLDQLEKQLDKDEFQGDRSMAAFCVINKQFQMFIDSQFTWDYDSQMTEKYFAEYTGIEVKQFRETLLLHMGNVKKSLAERTRHKRQYDRRMNERQMQSRESKVVSSKALDASLVVTECGGTKSDEHITSSSSGTYITHAVDADIRPVNDQVPFAEVQLTAQHNVLANEQQHTEQSEPIYDTYLLEKVDSNTTPDSTNMCHRGGEIDQDAEQYKVKSPLLKAELVRSKEMIEKETYNELSRSVKEASNEAKVKIDIDVIETINIELEHSVAKLLAVNEQLHKENEHLKQTYKELYDLIKKTRVQNKDNIREYVRAKPHHVIAPGSSRNSQEESYGSNDMAHNHHLEEARKKILERNRNSKPSVMPFVRLQNTANGSTPNPRRTNQTSRSLPISKSSCVTIMVVPKADHSRNSSSFSDSKHFFCSTCHKCVLNANHDACITKLLNEVNSRKVKPHKTKNSNDIVEQKSHTQKPGRQIFSGHGFSPKKTFAVYEKTSPRSCLRWKSTGKIFTTVGLKWIPTGKLFDSCTSKVDSEPPNGSNDDITNPYECDQTLNVSADILNLSAGTYCNPKKERLKVWLPKRLISHKPVVQGIQI